MTTSAVRQRNARKKSTTEASALARVVRNWETLAPCNEGSTREMAALEKKGEINSRRLRVSGSVERD
jgi:hypothetical protein